MYTSVHLLNLYLNCDASICILAHVNKSTILQHRARPKFVTAVLPLEPSFLPFAKFSLLVAQIKWMSVVSLLCPHLVTNPTLLNTILRDKCLDPLWDATILMMSFNIISFPNIWNGLHKQIRWPSPALQHIGVHHFMYQNMLWPSVLPTCPYRHPINLAAYQLLCSMHRTYIGMYRHLQLPIMKHRLDDCNLYL